MTGARRGGLIRAAAGWLGLPQRPPRAAGTREGGRLRRWGRVLVVRGLAQVAFRPGWWGAGLAVAGFVAGPWWLAVAGFTPPVLILGKLILERSSQINFAILSDVSNRVKTLRLVRRLRGWRQEMSRHGLTRQRLRRGEHVTLVPELERMQLGEFGVSAEIDLHRLGLILEDLDQHRKRLESVFLARCTLTQRGYGTAVVELRHTDPLARPVPVESLPAARRNLHVVTRVDERGRAVEHDVILPRLVIGGQGSGKSTQLYAHLWALHQAGIPFRLRVFDAKGGMELPELRELAHAYESRASGWADFVGAAMAALESRQRSLAGRGWKKLVRFTEAEPLDILVVDELLTVVSQRNSTVSTGRHRGMKAGDAWDQYLSQGRAAGYSAFALTQLGQKELLGHARGLFPHLTVLRVPVTEKEIVDRLLGSADLYPAHLIPAGDRSAGIGYDRTPEGQIVRSRGALLTGEQWRRVVARIAEDKTRRAEVRQERRDKAGATA